MPTVKFVEATVASLVLVTALDPMASRDSDTEVLGPVLTSNRAPTAASPTVFHVVAMVSNLTATRLASLPSVTSRAGSKMLSPLSESLSFLFRACKGPATAARAMVAADMEPPESGVSSKSGDPMAATAAIPSVATLPVFMEDALGERSSMLSL